MFKNKNIITLLLFSVSSTVMAQVADSTLPRPNGGPTIGTKHSTNSSDLSTALPEKTTITEYVHEICPTGLTGPDGTNRIVVSQRHVTTYKLNGSVVGVSETDWEDIDQDCMGREFRNVACPVNQRGEHKEERQKITADNGTFEYTNWNTIKNTCAYYKINDDLETRSQNCPTGQVGNFIEGRKFELWSDGSKRNYTNWFLHTNNCRSKKEGRVGLVSATGVTFGRNGFHVGTLSLDYQTSRLVCSGSFSSFNNTPGDTPTQTINGPFNSDHASCSISNDGFSGVVSGDCDSTSGGDADYCIGASKRVTIDSISNDQCIVNVKIPINRGREEIKSINTCL